MSEEGQSKMINSYYSLAPVSERQEGVVGTGAYALSQAECGPLRMGTQCNQIFRSSDFPVGARNTGFNLISTDFLMLAPFIYKFSLDRIWPTQGPDSVPWASSLQPLLGQREQPEKEQIIA